MNLTANKACAWSGVGFVFLFLLGFWVIGGFVPPPSPASSADQIAALYRNHRIEIRIGMLISAFAAILIVPWAASISTQLRRIEGPDAVWAPMQLVAAGLSTLVFEYILFFWIAATFRAERSDDAIQMMNDMGWIPFVGLAGTAMLQAVAIGVAILADKRPTPILPRWAGYTNLWCAMLFAPGAVNVFFKHGPLAWNGVISWYMVLTVFCIWFVVNTVVIIQAINVQQQEVPREFGESGVGSMPGEFAALRAEVAALREQLDRIAAPR
jgi:hypothetical protein